MEELFPRANIEVASRSEWVTLAQTRKKDSAAHLNTVFNKAAKDSKTAGDLPLSEFYELLSQVFSMYYKGDDPNMPFGPMAQMGASRTAIVTDFTEQNLTLLEGLVGKSGDSVVEARLADVLWQRKRDRTFAERAIEAYIDHAATTLRLDDDDWLHAKESLHRAAQLVKLLGQPQAFRDRLTQIAEAAIPLSAPEPQNYYRVLILKVMTEFGLCQDSSQWTDTCHQLATESAKNRNYEKARSYWECASDFAKIAKDKSKQKSMKEKETDSFIEEARWLKDSGASAMIVADRYSKAIEACRRLGNRRATIDELHQEMNLVQENVFGEMKKIEASIDVTKFVESGRKAVEDVPFDKALANIAAMAAPQSKVELRATVEASAKKFIFMHLMSAVSFNEKGRVVARTSPIVASEEDTREAGILAQMISHCAQGQQIAAISQIEAAREVLNRRLPLGSTLFYHLTAMNPFIPQGREEIYIRGLTAGLQGDWLNCAHLLIPQIEHSVRSYMERSGLLVTRLTDELTQKEHDLNKLLYEPATEQIFGEDLVFSMRVLLVEELGGNYRNKLAHGLLSVDSFHAGWVNYLWALTIRLCWIGKLIVQKQQQDNSESEDIEKVSNEDSQN